MRNKIASARLRLRRKKNLLRYLLVTPEVVAAARDIKPPPPPPTKRKHEFTIEDAHYRSVRAKKDDDKLRKMGLEARKLEATVRMLEINAKQERYRKGAEWGCVMKSMWEVR